LAIYPVEAWKLITQRVEEDWMAKLYAEPTLRKYLPDDPDALIGFPARDFQQWFDHIKAAQGG
jgi:hypothetical protein